MHGTNDLVAAISAHKPGDQIKLTLQRGSSKLTVTVTLGAQRSQPQAG